MWLDVLEPPPPPPFVQGTLVDMDSIMEHVSGSQDLLLSLLLSLFVDVTTFAAAAAAKSSEKKNRNMQSRKINIGRFMEKACSPSFIHS